MIDDDWQTLFEPKTKSDWLQKIEADAKGDFSQDLLERSFGQGVHMHAVQTGEDLSDVPHLDIESVYNSLKWKHSPGWAIGTQVVLSEHINETIRQLQNVSKSPVDHVVLAADDGGASLLEEHVHDLFSGWNAPHLSMHIRLTPRLAHYIRSRYSDFLSPNSSFEVQRIDAAAPHDTGEELNDPERALFEQAPLCRSVSCYIPGTSTDEANILGDVLAALDAYISGYENKTKGLTSLLARLQFIVTSSSNFYSAIARLRALRFLLTRFVKKHAPHYTSLLEVPIIAELDTGEPTDLSIADHLLRTTTMAMSAIIGGCTVLVTKPPPALSQKDQAETLRLATNLQLMLRHESHLDRVIDPAAGSYYVEVLTHQFIQSAWAYYEQQR